MRISCKITFIIVFLLSSTLAMAKDHLIYSIAEEIPMGYENEILKKNYYINMGYNQGVTNGATLNVFRTISKSNPYDGKKRVNYRVKIGELTIIHVTDDAAIATKKNFKDTESDPLFEIKNFMIGDYVAVNVGN